MKIELNENKIYFNNGSLKKEIHPFWLRERVDGEEFLDKGTQQRLFDPTELQENIEINHINLLNDHLEISFNDGASAKLSVQNILKEFSKNSFIEFIEKEEWDSVMKTIGEAVEALIDYRKAEGLSLEKDLKMQIQAIDSLHDQVPKYEQERIETIKERISTKLNDVLESVDFDRDRLEQEMIYFIEKLDVSEEKIRLKNHCAYFIETINSEDSNGKKLGFISQELGREINTMGSKANHSEIQKLVVQMKDSLEKIKEQVLNVL